MALEQPLEPFQESMLFRYLHVHPTLSSGLFLVANKVHERLLFVIDRLGTQLGWNVDGDEGALPISLAFVVAERLPRCIAGVRVIEQAVDHRSQELAIAPAHQVTD